MNSHEVLILRDSEVIAHREVFEAATMTAFLSKAFLNFENVALALIVKNADFG